MKIIDLICRHFTTAGGVPYIESTLGQDPNFFFAAAAVHTKITCIRTSCGRKPKRKS